MKSNIIRWGIAGIMLLALSGLISSPAIAGILPLPLEQTVRGNPALESGWVSPDHYEDPSIYVSAEYQTVNKVKCAIVHIRIADPSQIRTAMSEDSFDKTVYVKATALAKHVNAIAAVNGDFFKYYDHGYIIRQGVKYREVFSAKYPRDVLVIDDRGDFYAVRNATEEAMAAFMEETFPDERTVINTFSLGPVLVENGEVQEITTKEFQYRYPMQRVAIVQLGELQYAIVECDGKADATYGMELSTFAEYVKSLFPNCRLAYNLDGGGSTNVIVGDNRIHKNPNTRSICDILYFASAYTEE